MALFKKKSVFESLDDDGQGSDAPVQEVQQETVTRESVQAEAGTVPEDNSVAASGSGMTEEPKTDVAAEQASEPAEEQPAPAEEEIKTEKKKKRSVFGSAQDSAEEEPKTEEAPSAAEPVPEQPDVETPTVSEPVEADVLEVSETVEAATAGTAAETELSEPASTEGPAFESIDGETVGAAPEKDASASKQSPFSPIEEPEPVRQEPVHSPEAGAINSLLATGLPPWNLEPPGIMVNRRLNK